MKTTHLTISIALSMMLIACSTTRDQPVRFTEQVDGLFSGIFPKGFSVKTQEEFSGLLEKKWIEPEEYAKNDGKGPEGAPSSHTVDNCSSFLALDRTVVYGIDWTGSLANSCSAFKAISEAKPSKVSYLKGRSFTSKDIDTLVHVISDNEATNAYTPKDILIKNLNTQATNDIGFDMVDTDSMSVYGDLFTLTYGDFTGDGVEDVLISLYRSFHSKGGGNASDNSLFVLTRLSDKSELTIAKTLVKRGRIVQNSAGVIK